MEGVGLKIILDGLTVRRGTASITADTVLGEGLHIVHGPVGCGKSTLALAIAGLYPPLAGSVSGEGVASSILSLQFPEFHITAFTLAEECTSWGIDPEKILGSVGMADRAREKIFSISRGELKRLHLACVLNKTCDLLILDEPYSALDCGQKRVLSSRLSCRTTGITILFTHEREELPNPASFFEICGGELVRSYGSCHCSEPKGEKFRENRFQEGMIP